ncbi:MAG: WD40 repeat domain-containing serine/threonine protein kinase, partial [Verrucomicrobiota bacterium]
MTEPKRVQNRERELFLEILGTDSDEERQRLFQQYPEEEDRLRRLLKCNQTEDDFFEDGLPEIALSAEEDPPTCLGDFELIETVSSGASGVVWRARQTGLDREVALKLLRTSIFSGSEEWERFRNEAKVAGSLKHPNIVPVYEFGEIDGQPYLAMPFIEGETLSSKLRGLPGSPKTVVGLILKVTEAVDAAHRRGILHRDLKPGNILVDENGEPHVVDFGIAKQMQDSSGLTLSGQMLGTPYYMAPEQASGDSSSCSLATDVFSLGVILYELLSGKKPFRGDSVISLIRQVTEEKEERLSIIDRSIDKELEAIVETCLEKDPDKRYRTASALANDLRNWLEGRPVSVTPASPMRRVAKLVRRKPIHTALAGTGLLFTLTLAIGGPLIAIRQTSLSRDLADRTTELRRSAYRTSIGAALKALDHPAPAAEIIRLTDDLRPAQGESDLRGWEWYFLRRLALQNEESIPLAVGRIFEVAPGDDMRCLAIAGNEKSMLLDIENRRASSLSVIDGDVSIADLAIDKAGGKILVVKRDGNTTLYEKDNTVWSNQFDACRSLPGMHAEVALNVMRELVAIGSPTGEILIVDLPTGEILHSWKAHSRAVGSLGWNGSGETLASTSNRDSLRLWKIEQAFASSTLDIQLKARVNYVAWSPDESCIAVLFDEELAVFDSTTGT